MKTRFDLEPSHHACRGCGATIQQTAYDAELFLGAGQQFMLCGVCGLGYLSPDFTDAALQLFYTQYYRKLFLIDAARHYDAWFFRQIFYRESAQCRVDILAPILPQGAKILELGSGFGAFLGQLHAARPDVVLFATETDHANRKALLQGAAVTFLEPEMLHTHAPYDAVVGFHVLEHVKNPLAELVRVRDCVKPEGQIILEVPDIESDWGSWFFVQPAHVSYFSAASLTRLCARAGIMLSSVGVHPAGEYFKGILWAVGRSADEVLMPSASQSEIALLQAHLTCYLPTSKTHFKRWLKRISVQLLGANNVGAWQRLRHYVRNRKYFS